MQTKLNFALTLVLKVRVFVTRKWPIGKTENTLGTRWCSFLNMLNKC